MTLRDRRSIVGLVMRRRALTYTWFDGGELRDWGSAALRTRSAREVLKRIAERCWADVVVIETPPARPRATVAQRSFARALAQPAALAGADMRSVSQADVRRRWRDRGIRNKYSAALAIGRLCPDLEVLAPPARKNYMSEDPRIHVFTAAAVVLHLFGSSPDELAPT